MPVSPLLTLPKNVVEGNGVNGFKQGIRIEGKMLKPKGMGQTMELAQIVGGHKYARNMIIFNADEGKISGNWNGYVTPNDVSELIDQKIGKAEIIERIWRGRVDAHVEKTEKVDPKLDGIG
ncbi:altered inheritance of mitochondria 32 [Olea europaea subsp. europaea]|uniref:Altered inheritance of mitochondria 32 n=1 Tax=Olea europaea subsp. europaea TaxID=158383 RepID=A0A8S0RJY8_OLEEU|nr:altered inheritance of mitochondria 32 [Olea europaea subsp. europaea]